MQKVKLEEAAWGGDDEDLDIDDEIIGEHPDNAIEV